jgi:hypothetical protein
MQTETDVLVWTAVAVFIVTAIITLLAIIEKPRLIVVPQQWLKPLYYTLLIQIVGIGVLTFKEQMSSNSLVQQRLKEISESVSSWKNFSKDIRSIQAALTHKGIDTYMDGVPGTETFQSLKKFQIAQGLTPATGQIDKVTLLALLNGSQGQQVNLPNKRFALVGPINWNVFSSRVRALKETIQSAGCLNEGESDQIFRPELTEDIVCFQQKNGMTADGALGTDLILTIVQQSINSKEIKHGQPGLDK